jgi:hypothetical protein
MAQKCRSMYEYILYTEILLWYILCDINLYLLVVIKLIIIHNGRCIKIIVNVFYNRPFQSLEVHQKTVFIAWFPEVQSIYCAKEFAPLVGSEEVGFTKQI